MSDTPVIRGIFHCSIGVGKVLCGSTSGPSKVAPTFARANYFAEHWLSDKTYWRKCRDCENHPDLPLFVLGRI